MDILERYLQAVGQYLPAETRGDTLAELRENLLAQMEGRAEELGRPVTDADVIAILRAHGKPEVVALRYLPQRSLIGPTVFPFFTLTLSRVLPLVVLANAVAKAVEFAVAPHQSVAGALGTFALGLWTSLLISAAIITVIFAAIEEALRRGRLGEQWHEWDPAKLPAVKGHTTEGFTAKSQAKRAVELGAHCLWMAYVLWVPWHPFWLMGPGVFYMGHLGVALAPVWHTFYALLIVLLTVQLVIRLVAFAPRAQAWMEPLRLVTDVLGVVAVGFLACATVYFVAADATANLQHIARVNQSVGLGFRIALVVSVIGFARDIWKYAKRCKPVQRFAF